MQFCTPGGIRYEIPEEWWSFCEMESFVPLGRCYGMPLCENEQAIELMAGVMRAVPYDRRYR